MTVRHARAADLPMLSRSLARAFADDPMMVWIAEGLAMDERIAAFGPGFFMPSLQAGIGRGHTYATCDLRGAAIWSPPDVRMFDDATGAAFGAAMNEHLGQDAVLRTMAIGELVGSRHPKEPHFYLFVLGVAEQGHGLGALLLHPVLERCDAHGLPAYLESSNSRNLGFYRRHGFEVQWEARAGDDGPMLRGLWREPSRSADPSRPPARR